MTRYLPLLGALILLSSCGEDTTSPDPDGGNTVGMGKARISFAVSNTVRQSPNLQDELMGNIYGSIWKKDDVSITGPKDGAEDVDGINLEGVDLRTADVSAQSEETISLPVGRYIYLGFFDVDGSSLGSEDPGPETGDPVTLPSDDFEIKADLTNPVVIDFDLIYN